MKARTFYTLCAGLFLCITSDTFAQTSVNKASLFSTAVKNDELTKDNSAVVNLKVQKAFMRQFGEVTSQSWRVAGQNFLSHFYMNGLPTNALFSKNGYLIYTITYSTEKQMPANLRKLVKSEYLDYDITMASEIKQDNRDIWVVQLQNTNEIITARIENGELEEVQQFNRSK